MSERKVSCLRRAPGRERGVGDVEDFLRSALVRSHKKGPSSRTALVGFNLTISAIRPSRGRCGP